MRYENIPPSPSPEQPPLAPYDPPEPAPQAQAWRRALRVIGCVPHGNEFRMSAPIARRATRHRW
jgi:hypothetical protein